MAQTATAFGSISYLNCMDRIDLYRGDSKVRYGDSSEKLTCSRLLSDGIITPAVYMSGEIEEIGERWIASKLTAHVSHPKSGSAEAKDYTRTDYLSFTTSPIHALGWSLGIINEKLCWKNIKLVDSFYESNNVLISARVPVCDKWHRQHYTIYEYRCAPEKRQSSTCRDFGITQALRQVTCSCDSIPHAILVVNVATFLCQYAAAHSDEISDLKNIKRAMKLATKWDEVAILPHGYHDQVSREGRIYVADFWRARGVHHHSF